MVVILSRAVASSEPEIFPLVVVRLSDELVIEPTVTDGYESSREAGTIVHPVLGRPSPDITIRPATLRTGTLRFWFDSETASRGAENAHAEGGVFSLEYAGLPTVVMTYVASGQIGRVLDRTLRAWIVSIDFTEVES